MVIYPVIPKGEILLRIIPTAVHTTNDVDRTIAAFKEVKAKLVDGKYQSDTIGSMMQQLA